MNQKTYYTTPAIRSIGFPMASSMGYANGRAGCAVKMYYDDQVIISEAAKWLEFGSFIAYHYLS
jgi:hypothetical protein